MGRPFPVALVGLSCRFPGAADVAEFWSLLEAGKDAVTEIPDDRWDVDAYYHPDPAKPGKMYTRAGGFIANIDKFDAGFFGISPREARRIDPQQRLLLELTWEAFESAGIVPARIAASQTGVFVGISVSDYAALQREEPDQVDPYIMSGSALSNAANRISYIFDLHGPSFTVDTACSSSLVAVHEACVSLWRGESSLAIAAGVHALLSPSGAVGFSKARMLSPTGRCRPFDAAGDGYVRSEGGAVVILQPLAQAIAEKNPDRPGRDHLRRGAWHRHERRRPDRMRCLGDGARRFACARRLLPNRLGQEQYRPPRTGLWDCRAAESGPCAPSPRDPAYVAFHGTQPENSVRGTQSLRRFGTYGIGSGSLDHGG